MFAVIALLSLALFNGALAQTSLSPTVDVGYATYLGNQTYPNTVAYLGIPYAEPPVGNMRFRATVPLNTTRVREEASASGQVVINATYYPDFCIQGTTGGMCIAACHFWDLSDSRVTWRSRGCGRSRIRRLLESERLRTIRCERRRQLYVLGTHPRPVLRTSRSHCL